MAADSTAAALLFMMPKTLSASGVHCHCAADKAVRKDGTIADERRARNSGGGELLPCLFVRPSVTIRANCRSVTGGQFMFTVPNNLALSFPRLDGMRRVAQCPS